MMLKNEGKENEEMGARETGSGKEKTKRKSRRDDKTNKDETRGPSTIPELKKTITDKQVSLTRRTC